MKRALVLAALVAAGPAAAEPLRLRADALATARAPTGLLVLDGQDRLRPWISAEALVWLGAGDETEADALAISVLLRDPRGRAEARLGRQVFAVGALRPVHADGIAGRVRLPGRFTLETFGGLPVVPRFGERDWDWLAGVRAAHRSGPARIGLGWMQQRDFGSLAYHELAADATLVPTGNIDLAATGAWDLVSSGLSEMQVSAAWRRGAWRVEAYGGHRSPARLLPATSLFTVLGDVAAQRFGFATRWRAAPRLDVWATTGVRRVGDDVGLDLTLRGRLRLDDAGSMALGLELRRGGIEDGGWTGARTTFSAALGQGWGVATELELVVPDDPEHLGPDGMPIDRGVVWPWGLAAVTWQPAPRWHLAAAIEAGVTPSDVYRLDLLARVSRAWEGP